MKLSHDGLCLWYGTPDAPAPLDEIVDRAMPTIVVGASPANPTNAVRVAYRVDGGMVQSASGRELRTDYARGAQYFVVNLPALPVGETVEYCPMLSCGGRQVPSPGASARFPARFRLAARRDPSPQPTSLPRVQRPRWPLPTLDFLTAVTVHIEPPQLIGETPEGVRIDFYSTTGTAVGPALSGKILHGASDHMIVRPDGVGLIRVRAVIETNDGALLEIEELGKIDFGEDGYRKALASALPSRSELLVSPRVLTGHPKYRWLNRAHCMGAGNTDLDQLVFRYDFFAVSPKTRGDASSS